MPRTGRVVLADYPHHVVQRGHDRQAVFAADADFRRYLTDLKELKDTFNVRVFAYCLMTMSTSCSRKGRARDWDG